MMNKLKDAIHVVHLALIHSTNDMNDHDKIKVYKAMRLVEETIGTEKRT